MELIDIRWCLASCIRRAQWFMEITSRQELGGMLSTKLGFDKSKGTCFRCKQKGHFKRECVNQEVADHGNHFKDHYYKKAIYQKTGEHTSGESLKRIAGNSSKEKSQASMIRDQVKPKIEHAKHRVIQEDEVFNRNDYLGDDDETALIAEVKQSAFVAIVKEKTKEEIQKEKTYRERCIVDYRIQEMEQEYEEARNYGRYDKKRECYINSKGDPLVHPSKVVYNNVLVVIPLSGEYYSNVAKDKDYVKKLDKIIRDVMTACLRQRDEERMKKNVDDLVDELKKFAEEEKVEGKKEEEAIGEEVVTKNNRIKMI
ncbi:putative transcription factor interactor and regulator CCHC(Zn) family [Helianthus annuus]|nr:putative transcription factor interactor and regulator CCHC(Zn) family [Helianthus annuus]KAJ0506174.1 putative transcription factor interactor and regulator CCHC(Zn) family [Helianthus annuus]KAJ0679098.1 putative transcription factor interactor and regulator CCHC(Zn) family [Helianthus annuus]KAJ0867550.1 putative transcription factor interactor and regulator CCHC(Zn) family [Helianthus annuus]